MKSHTKSNAICYIPTTIRYGKIVNLDRIKDGTAVFFADACIMSCHDSRKIGSKDSWRTWINRGNMKKLLGKGPEDLCESEFANSPIEGFRIVGSNQAGPDLSDTCPFEPYYGTSGCLKVLDPRGMVFPLNAYDLLATLLKDGVSIGADGIIKGKLLWGTTQRSETSLPRFRLFSIKGEDYQNAMHEGEKKVRHLLFSPHQ